MLSLNRNNSPLTADNRYCLARDCFNALKAIRANLEWATESIEASEDIHIDLNTMIFRLQYAESELNQVLYAINKAATASVKPQEQAYKEAVNG